MLVTWMPEIVNIFLKCYGVCMAAVSERVKKKRMRRGKSLKWSRYKEVLLASLQWA